MKRSLSILLGVTSSALVLALGAAAGPASAARTSVDDPAGDAAGPGLDITSARFRNLDHRVVVEVGFVRSVRGDLVVSVDRRHGSGLRLVSEYRPAGHTRNLVLRGSFGDATGSTGDAATVRCRGYRVTWSTDDPTVRLSMPSHCLHDGDYGALQFAVLTERGADTDYAPEDADASRWVARG